ncbi:MAG: hypothetical protein Ct9H90mP27_7570 [Gammaproteobacteria bacterium]|nr:MAG: hypothetical protein Ct9H90mP27_7570 [Gammaproteobacteria bacterium]
MVTVEAAAKAERGENFRKEAAMAKLVATEAGGRVVDRCMQMFGGLGSPKIYLLKDGFAKCAFDALERGRVRFRDM